MKNVNKIIVIILIGGILNGFYTNKTHLLKLIENKTKSNITEFGLKTELLEDNKEIIQKISKVFGIKIQNDIAKQKIENNILKAEVFNTQENGENFLNLVVKFKKDFKLTKEFGEMINNKIFYLSFSKEKQEPYDKQEIISILENNNFKNIQSTQIDKINTITCFTDKYKKVIVNKKEIDLNLVIKNYENKKELIIGSPILLIDY